MTCCYAFFLKCEVVGLFNIECTEDCQVRLTHPLRPIIQNGPVIIHCEGYQAKDSNIESDSPTGVESLITVLIAIELRHSPHKAKIWPTRKSKLE